MSVFWAVEAYFGSLGASTGQATMTARTAFSKIELSKEILFNGRVWLGDLYINCTFDAITGIYNLVLIE